eukprot:GEMP01013146.1.p1 GENE.GEMP01013146.1~~GEMP01013146.1.p1  ORF type:complete len:486 (+),score=103.96 GEMP01013146.1:30-1460(+)
MSVLAPCTACLDVFETQDGQREHYKSDRHTYNVKRKTQDLKPVSSDLWAQKLKVFSGTQSKEPAKKGTAHLKKKEIKLPSETNSAVVVSEPRLTLEQRTARHCLFDDHESASVEANLAYMKTKYSFFLPDPEYLVLPEDLLKYLAEKIYEGNTCLYCDRAFTDSASCLRHMFDKGHTRIGTETYTRTGQYSRDGSEEMQAQLEPFYDYSTSVKEINLAKIAKVVALKNERPEAREEISEEQKLQKLFEFFDDDEDGMLNFEEASNLYELSQTATLSEEKFAEVLASLNCKDGINSAALAILYEQLGTLNADFCKIDDWEDLGDGEEEHDDEDDYEIKECHDEDEFKKLMEEYGLQPCSITLTGDLRLPDGSVAAHRQYHYIYRQRGRRLTDEERRLKHKAVGGSRRALLMLSNAQSTGVCRIAVSSRQRTVQGKQIIAVLRQQQKSNKLLGMKQNVMQTRYLPRIRSIRGDAAGGR